MMKEYNWKSAMDNETKLGGIFGVIAICAIFVEVYLSGFTRTAIVAGCKDLCGTLVSVMVFYIAIKSYLNNNPKTLLEVLEQKLILFEDDYLPMIYKVSDFRMRKNSSFTQGFSILPNLNDCTKLMDMKRGAPLYNDYAAYNKHFTGKFVDLPPNADMISKSNQDEYFVVEFGLIQSNSYVENFLEQVGVAIQTKYGHIYSVKTFSNKLHVTIPSFHSSDDMDIMFGMFGLVIRLYQIGNLGPKRKQA